MSRASYLLRLKQATEELAYPTLLVNYRNDPGAPATGDSLLLLGQEEYEDVAAAVDYALAHGATDVVVVGPSMGGAITLAYAFREERPVIRGLILEAPAADIREKARLRSGEALPVGGPIGDVLMASGRLFVSMRTGLDFDKVDYVERADELSVPVLLFHGTDDSTVPVEIGQALSDARPDLVELHVVDGAAHVRAWNENPDAYRTTIADFLERVGRSN
jgi:pimeloyl-ACP methyl ester carboxylesterase